MKKFNIELLNDVTAFFLKHSLVFKPQEDITAYELALIVGAINVGLSAIEVLPDCAKRHFVEVS